MKRIERFKVAWISLTYQCNNKCRWCYAASNDSSIERKHLDFKLENEVVRLFSELKIPRTILIGGEPTLYSNLENFIQNLTNSGIKTGMITNGRKFKNRNFVKRLKRAGLNYTTISIEGSCPEIHDKTTCIKGSLEESLEGLRIAQEEGIIISTNTLISSINLNDLDDCFKMLIEKNIKNIGYNICGMCITKNSNNDYIINPKDAISAFERIYLLAKQKNIEVRLVTPMPHCNFDNKLITELKTKNLIANGPCQLVHGRNFVLDYNGDVVPCTHLTEFPIFNAVKNNNIISGEEFLSRYNSEEAQKFRETICRYPSVKCKNCNESCTGGCPLYWIRIDPEKEIRGCLTT